MSLIHIPMPARGVTACARAVRSESSHAPSPSRLLLSLRPQGPRCGIRCGTLARREAHPRSTVVGKSSRSSFIGEGGTRQHLGQHLTLSQANTCLERRSSTRIGSPAASLFGVGAPEALVIGVVALIVFGPKGLAEVARNIGKTLRTFQPTIKELQEVTREFRDTLQQEIGLDEIRQGGTTTRPPPTYTSAPTPLPPASPTTPDAPPAATASASSPAPAYTAEEMAKITEEQLKKAMELNTLTEEARRASEIAAWKGTPPGSVPSVPVTLQSPTPVTPPPAAPSTPPAAPSTEAAAPSTPPAASAAAVQEGTKAQSTPSPSAEK